MCEKIENDYIPEIFKDKPNEFIKLVHFMNEGINKNNANELFTLLDNITPKTDISNINEVGEKYVSVLKTMQNMSWIYGFKLSKVIVKSSKIHGKGLFCIDKIHKDEIITLYPGDIVQYTEKLDNKQSQSGINKQNMVLHFKSPRFESEVDVKLKNEHSFQINDNFIIIASDKYTSDTSYLGQFINDGAKNSSTKSEKIYNNISTAKKNSEFRTVNDKYVVSIATRDIEPGEEILTTYGVEYWNSYNEMNTK